MISRVEINLRKIPRPMQTVQQLFNPGEWIPILNGVFSQSAIIDTHAPLSIFLWNKDNGRVVKALTRSNPRLLKQCFNLTPEFLHFCIANPIRAFMRWN